MKAIEDYLKDEMRWAQATYETFANRRREPAPAFQVGDEVFVDARHIKTTRPTKKLDWKNLGPFRITKVVSSHAYRLELPPSLKIHDVLPTSRLRLAPKPDDALPGQRIEPPPPVVVEGDDEYLVERIEDSRFNRRRRRFEYLVRWTGYHELIWESVSELDQIIDVERFYQQFPDKPKSPTLDLSSTELAP